jgi:hypothetical protein
VITIGIGLQAETRDRARVEVSDSAAALAKFMGRKAPFLSTRGDFTRDWLRSIGVQNAVTTGCPSLYMQLNPVDPINADDGFDPDGVVLQATRYGMSQAFSVRAGVNQTLFRLAGTLGLDMIYQSEPEEIDALLHGAASTQMNNTGAVYLPTLYGLTDKAAFDFWLNRHGKVFFDLDVWAGYS